MKFIEKGAPQFKANLHSHSTRSDGELTPEQLIAAYRGKGYDILAITDHEAPYEYNACSTPEFLLITGYEAYIRPAADCSFDPYGPEIHLNLLAKEPYNRTFVGYDPNFCKYMPHDQAEALPRAELGPRQYTRQYIQSFIDAANASGYLVSYNHPGWSMQSPEDIWAYDGCYSLELFNYGCDTINGAEANVAVYDGLLRRGKFWYCHGADDNHNKAPLDHPLSDSFGAWTMILAKELTYPAVMEALENGRFYASTGPRITALEIAEGELRLQCTPASRIILHMSMKRCVNLTAPAGQSLTEARIALPQDAPYLYLSVHAADGTQAYTRAFCRGTDF